MYFSTQPLRNDTLSYVPKEVKVSRKYLVFNLNKGKTEKAQWSGKQEVRVVQSALYIPNTLVASTSYKMNGLKQIAKVPSHSLTSPIFKTFHLYSLWFIKSTSQFIFLKTMLSKYFLKMRI